MALGFVHCWTSASFNTSLSLTTRQLQACLFPAAFFLFFYFIFIVVVITAFFVVVKRLFFMKFDFTTPSVFLPILAIFSLNIARNIVKFSWMFIKCSPKSPQVPPCVDFRTVLSWVLCSMLFIYTFSYSIPANICQFGFLTATSS